MRKGASKRRERVKNLAFLLKSPHTPQSHSASQTVAIFFFKEKAELEDAILGSPQKCGWLHSEARVSRHEEEEGGIHNAEN